MKSTRVFLPGLALAAIVIVLLLARPALAQETPTAATAVPLAATPAQAAATAPQPMAGKDSYTQNCAPCHGETGQGDGPSASGLSVAPAALGNYEVASAKSLAEWFEITKEGNMQRMMPPWKNRLNDQQIWDTVAYAWSLHTSSQEIEQGKQIYDTNCAACHGPDGKGANEVGVQPGAPDLTDFAKTSTVSQAAWAEIVANGKGDADQVGAMPAFAGTLSDAEQRASLEYVRSLSFGGPLFRGPLAAGTGIITGTVTNVTTAAPAAGVPVQLGIFDASSLLEQRSAETDASGNFSFGDLPTEPGLAFIARAEYPAGIPYSSEPTSFEAGQTALNLPLSVYETTTDPSGVRAERVHYIIEFDGTGQAQVGELWIFSQDGNRAYVGDENGVLRFPLPAGAQNLGIDGDDGSGRFQPTDDGFVDRMPLQPGQNVRQILFRYALPFNGDSLDLAQVLPYNAANVNALVSDVGQEVSSPQLRNQGVRSTQNGNYVSLLGQNLPAGHEVVIRMAGLPSAGGVANAAGASGAGLSRGLLFGLIGLAAVAAVVLVALPIVRKRSAAPAYTAAASRDELADALARLDMAYEAGEVSESAYRDQRLRLKAQLRDLLRKEGAA
jgi:mono/diheme cytochrome c family protein